METPLLHIQDATFLHIQGTVHSPFHPAAEHVSSLLSTMTFCFQRGCIALMNVAVPKRTAIFLKVFMS